MDIDIDTPTTFHPKKVFGDNVTLASMVLNDKLTKHPCGVYFQHIPVDPITALSAIPHEHAENEGFFKIDFLHLQTLNLFESKKEIRELLKIDPDWEMLTDYEVVKKLFQMSKQYEVLCAIKPKNVEELADAVAIIRTNKIKLLDKYIKNKRSIRKELYTKREDKDLRKSHAIPYALIIVLQLHLIKLGRL